MSIPPRHFSDIYLCAGRQGGDEECIMHVDLRVFFRLVQFCVLFPIFSFSLIACAVQFFMSEHYKRHNILTVCNILQYGCTIIGLA